MNYALVVGNKDGAYYNGPFLVTELMVLKCSVSDLTRHKLYDLIKYSSNLTDEFFIYHDL